MVGENRSDFFVSSALSSGRLDPSPVIGETTRARSIIRVLTDKIIRKGLCAYIIVVIYTCGEEDGLE